MITADALRKIIADAMHDLLTATWWAGFAHGSLGMGCVCATVGCLLLLVLLLSRRS